MLFFNRLLVFTVYHYTFLSLLSTHLFCTYCLLQVLLENPVLCVYTPWDSIFILQYDLCFHIIFMKMDVLYDGKLKLMSVCMSMHMSPPSVWWYKYDKQCVANLHVCVYAYTVPRATPSDLCCFHLVASPTLRCHYGQWKNEEMKNKTKTAATSLQDTKKGKLSTANYVDPYSFVWPL